MKEVLENIGLSAAVYREGYIALAEDIITNGRQIDVSLNSNDAYFVYQPDDSMSFWGYYSKDEVLSLLALYDTAGKCFSRIKSCRPFESNPARGAFTLELINSKNPDASLVICAESIDYMLISKKIAGLPAQKPLPALINGFLSGGSLKIYKNENQYREAHNWNPGADTNSIVRLESVNRDETPVEIMPFAHLTAGFKKYAELINPYSREKFFAIEAGCQGIDFSLFTRFNRQVKDALNCAEPGSIIEADAYFTAIVKL